MEAISAVNSDWRSAPFVRFGHSGNVEKILFHKYFRRLFIVFANEIDYLFDRFQTIIDADALPRNRI
jgi:hypothetical protein